MTINIQNYWLKSKRWLVRYRVLLASLAAAVIITPVLLVWLAYALIMPNGQYILSPAQAQAKHIRVGLVLGAGIRSNGTPFRELQGRLDVAANALNKGYVDKLILSGDNRRKGYDEPTAMLNYLVNVKHIDKTKLQPDFAGRSTYESCDRAARVFGQKEVLIISAGTHLPRAIYLCRHLGVTAYGLSSHVEANNAHRRELLARVKAVYNIYVRGENTVLGTSISF